MIFFENQSTDPEFNLALEEVLWGLPEEGVLFLLWRGAPSVIVGRNQNVPEEVNLRYAEERRIPIIRRQTGGGAVYHDGGNLNYTFVVPLKESAKEDPLSDFVLWTEPIRDTLIRLGLPVRFTGRNDLTLDGKKFSGTAQARRGGRLLLHGTLLFDVDLETMERVLNVDADKFQSKGVSSVRSRVTNLASYLPGDWTFERFREAVFDGMASRHSFEVSAIPGRFLPEIERLKREKYGNRIWNFGRSPRSNFRTSRRYSWGKVQVDLFLDRGKIAEVSITGDFFTTGDPAVLEARLTGLDYTISEVGQISEVEIKSVFPQWNREEFLEFLFG